MKVAQCLNSGHVYSARSNWLPQTQRICPRLELHVSPDPNSGVLCGSEGSLLGSGELCCWGESAGSVSTGWEGGRVCWGKQVLAVLSLPSMDQVICKLVANFGMEWNTVNFNCDYNHKMEVRLWVFPAQYSVSSSGWKQMLREAYRHIKSFPC